jgi:hypothetical protein
MVVDLTPPPVKNVKNVIWTIVGIVAAYVFLGPLGGGLVLGIFVILRKSLTSKVRIWLVVLAGMSVAYGAVFSLLPWWLLWLHSSPSVVVTHG